MLVQIVTVLSADVILKQLTDNGIVLNRFQVEHVCASVGSTLTKQSGRRCCANVSSCRSPCEASLRSSVVTTGIIRILMPPHWAQHLAATARNCAKSWSLIKKTCRLGRVVSINSVFISGGRSFNETIFSTVSLCAEMSIDLSGGECMKYSLTSERQTHVDARL